MKTTTYKQIALVTAAVLGVATFAIDAQAGQMAPATQSLVVRYSDLDLNTAAGAQLLYRRIRAAAEQVCGADDSTELARKMVAKACMQQAIVTSVQAVNNVQLTSTANAAGYAVKTHLTLATAQ